jgi:hypothetical protein
VLAEFRAQSKASTPTIAHVAPKAMGKPMVAEDPEAVARKRFSGLLANSRNLIKAGIRDSAEKNLKLITTEAPGTAIAAEAQKELDVLHQQR